MKRETIVRITALSLFLTVYLVLTWTFLLAWASPEKAVRIAINAYGEASVELILLLAGFIPIFAGTGYFISDTVRNIDRTYITDK